MGLEREARGSAVRAEAARRGRLLRLREWHRDEAGAGRRVPTPRLRLWLNQVLTFFFFLFSP